MADIKFTAFIEDTVRNQQGGVFVLKTSETHRRKNDRDEWETTSRTYRDVKVSRESGINLDQFAKGDRVEVAGSEKTERIRSTNGGKDFYPLVVWADSITRAGNDRQASPAQDDTWATPGSFDDGQTPF